MTFDSTNNEEHLYFITATICGWKRLLESEPFAQIILQSLEWLRTNRKLLLFAYVIMPNHAHVILKPVHSTIGSVLRDLGSFTAHKMIKMLKNDGQMDLLGFFHSQRRDERSNYSVWQDIQAKNIYSSEFLYQKIEYIHNNPVVERWALVENRADYKYSSAGYYDLDKPGLIRVDDVREYLDA